MLDRNRVGATGQREGFLQLHTANLGGLKPKHHFFGITLQIAFTWHDVHDRLVGWEGPTRRSSNQARLRDIGAFLVFIEQDGFLCLVGHVCVI